MTNTTNKSDDKKELPTNQTKPLVPWVIMLVGLGLLLAFFYVSSQG